MHSCDVLIVGGGPAGSACARHLVRAGLDVTVIDKALFPRDKVCAGWITPAVVAALELDLNDYHRGRTLQVVTAFRTGLIGGATLPTAYPATVSYGIRRVEFDHYLLQRSGARLVVARDVRRIERQGGQWVIDGVWRAPMLVGAGGHFCPVSRHLGNRLGRGERVVAAREMEFALDHAQSAACGVVGEAPELYFCEDLKGYGWAVRKGDVLNLGLGREDPHRLAERVDAFVDFLKASGRIPPATAPRMKGHAYLLYGHARRRLADDGVLLIGDAAGLAYTRSGEGIRPAVESGILAAQTIARTAGDYGAARLAHYAEDLERRFGPRGRAADLATWLPAPVRRAVAGLLLASPWLTRHLVLDRWFLHRHQTPLAAGD